MPHILGMAEGLLAVAREHLARHRTHEGLRALRQLLRRDELPPVVAAEANRLIAEVHCQRAEYPEARQVAAAAVACDPRNPAAHLLLARSNAMDEDRGSRTAALVHFAKAAKLSKDPAVASAYGRQLVESRQERKGMKLLAQTFADHGDRPEVVSEYAEALISAGRDGDAETLVLTASVRNGMDGRFVQVRKRVEQRVRQRRLFGGSPRSDGRDVIPLRDFDRAAAERPRSPRRPRPAETTHPSREPAGPPVLEEGWTVVQTLRRVGAGTTARVYGRLGLFGKATPAGQRAEIGRVLADPAFVTGVVRGLAADARRLLRTLVRSGGHVPATVLFQNTGPEAPPPDYVQPLLETGLMFLGRAAAGRNPKLVAMVPLDVLACLARVLRIGRRKPA